MVMGLSETFSPEDSVYRLYFPSTENDWFLFKSNFGIETHSQHLPSCLYPYSSATKFAQPLYQNSGREKSESDLQELTHSNTVIIKTQKLFMKRTLSICPRKYRIDTYVLSVKMKYLKIIYLRQQERHQQDFPESVKIRGDKHFLEIIEKVFKRNKFRQTA